MELCVHVSDLRKSYGQVHAVDGISFDVEYGKVFGFLGPNGAGKTTTIRVLTTLVHPTSGDREDLWQRHCKALSPKSKSGWESCCRSPVLKLT